MRQYDHERMTMAFTVSLLSVNDSYSCRKGASGFSGISEDQLKRFLTRDWDPVCSLEKVVDSLDVDWSTGWLMIDDTIIEKPYAEKIEGVYWLYSSKNSDFVQGINTTVLAWSDGIQTIPIRYQAYEKDSDGKPIQTKTDFALEALKYAFDKGIRPRYICFDSKFSSNKILQLIHNSQNTYYCQLPSNRLFNGQQLKDTRFQPYPKQGYLKGVGHRLSVAKHCKRYYATNATGQGITRQQIVRRYRVRWAIEDLFRALKQLTHLEKCKSRSLQAQRRYIYLCFRALLLLQQQNANTLYQAKTHFQQKFLNLKVKADKALKLLAA